MATADQWQADRVCELLGLPAGSRGPGGVGLALLHSTLYAGGWLSPAWRDAPPILSRPLIRLWPQEDTPRWIHVYDCNGAYLSAARNSMFATGQPERANGIGTVVRLGAISAPETVPAGADGWYMQATHSLIEEQGGSCVWHEAYTFPGRHRVLRPWAEALWKARQAADSDEDRAFLKRSATITIGYMAHPPKDGRFHWWYQPQWRAEIIAQHAAKMSRMVLRWRAAGAAVLGVDDDAIAIASREPDALAACPDPAQIGAGLGKLKVQISLAPGQSGPAFRAMASMSAHRWFTSLKNEGAS